jgi:CYTH domain-containing protein
VSGDGLEIERKYLLRAAPSDAELAALEARTTRIEQVYLRSSDDWVRRVRRVEIHGHSRYVLTRKRDLDGGRASLVREEIEADLSPDEYARLAAEADPTRRVIRKVRHVIRSGRWAFELDVFADPAGLVLLEVELDDPDEVPELPAPLAALVVRDVSAEPAYTNHQLALLPDAAVPAAPHDGMVTGVPVMDRAADAAQASPSAPSPSRVEPDPA